MRWLARPRSLLRLIAAMGGVDVARGPTGLNRAGWRRLSDPAFSRRMRRCALAVAAFAASSMALAPTASAQVSNMPASGTPELASTGSPQQIRELVQCGDTMYAVGTFTQIAWNGTVYRRSNVFSFAASAPYTISSWAPRVNGEVNTIAFDGSSCNKAYLGGEFSAVHGTAVKNIAAVDTTTGAVASRFAHSASAEVDTIASAQGHLLVGGFFTSVNGTRQKYFASLSPVTGAVQKFVDLKLSGNYSYCSHKRCAAANNTRVYNQQISHKGSLDLVEGDFTSVGGQPRQQIFMLDLQGPRATVTRWTSPEFSEHCWFTEPFYLRTAAWSPNDSTIYVGTTGFHLYNRTRSSFPLAGLCDAAAAFPARQKTVNPLWINYTGCDSIYASAADASLAYFGGHERWSQNSEGCNFQGPGAYPAQGMEGLDPATGDLYLNAAGTEGYYTRARGLGADDMLITDAGLWIASDDVQNNGQCGGVPGHSGICFLPYGMG